MKKSILSIILAITGSCSYIDKATTGLPTAQVTNSPKEPQQFNQTNLTQNPATYLKVEDFEGEDLKRFQGFNYLLKSEGFPEITENAKITEDNLIEFRRLYKGYNDLVDKLGSRWLTEANMILSPKRKDLEKKLAAGQFEGLPVMDEKNPFRRNHPYEAISQVLHGGKSYVLRVHPKDAPSLFEIGTAYDLAREERKNKFSSTLRKLFCIPREE